MKTFVFIILILSQITTATVNIKRIIKNKNIIWGFDFLSKDEIIYSLKKGEIFIFNLTTKTQKKITHNINFHVIGQGGLLDIAVFSKKEKTVYITYSKKIKDSYTTALAVGNISHNNSLIVKEIFSAKTNSDNGRHFGSRVIFDKSNQVLYMSIGDRTIRDKAQDLNYHNGKTIRLNLNGSIPSDNPFINTKNALKDIYSYGHRNSQGLYLHKGVLWQVEFGPRGGDEINIIKKGLNYGWPIISYGREYWGPKIGTTHKEGLQQPLHYYTPSISPSGLMIYEGNYFKSWQGDLFIACLSGTQLRRVKIINKKIIEEQELLKDKGWRIRQVKNGPNGRIYFSTDTNGLYKIY